MDGAIVIDAPWRAFYRRVDLTGYRYVDSENDVLYAQDFADRYVAVHSH